LSGEEKRKNEGKSREENGKKKKLVRTDEIPLSLVQDGVGG